MISTPASLFKLLSSLFVAIPLAVTCVDCSNNEVQIAQAIPRINENIRYPQSAAVIDVTSPEYKAIPNDGKDDTAAIQKALSQFPNQGRVIYLPNGVYNISDSLHWANGVPFRSDYKRIVLQGQSRDGVVIQLNDSSPKFQNPDKPRPVISTGFNPDLDPNSKEFKASQVAQRFSNSVRNLTINIGKNNPGAQGLNFVANNQGAVRSVKIISSDNQGTTGLALTHGEVGPLLVEDVEIIGFDEGISTNNGINGLSMQNITVRDQKRAGFYNRGQVVSLEKFNSVNSVPAIINGSNPHTGNDRGSTLTLVNAKLIGRGGASKTPAISSVGFIYARNVVSSGYSNVLSNNTNAKNAAKSVKGNAIDEFASHPILSKFPSPSRSLKLTIKQFPKLEWDDPKTWVSVEKFGAIASDKKDDTAAFQAAIDSGATTVVVPKPGIFTINGSLKLRGNVRRFLGTEGVLNGSGEIVASDGSQPTLIIENFFVAYNSKLKWKNVANRTIVYRSILGLDLESQGTGDLFIDDAAMHTIRLLNPAQHIWARQLNPEGSVETAVVNRGAKLWILGLKTEGSKTKIETTDNGFTEVLGGLIYATNKQAPSDPLFRIINASCSFVGVTEAYFDKDTYQIWVEETRGNETKKLMRREIPDRRTANGQALVLYTGFKK
ncbi:glycosyl hydrolase family 28-related protein [Tolypothrix sp. VBCCA 56010]|uniref:glycosyl hydrolase family 28-related protein n=1 Tax=Tolypothrix sp. VBCCA 56010 TaxID=3137731 RepID=UPI003D7E2D1A